MFDINTWCLLVGYPRVNILSYHRSRPGKTIGQHRWLICFDDSLLLLHVCYMFSWWTRGVNIQQHVENPLCVSAHNQKMIYIGGGFSTAMHSRIAWGNQGHQIGEFVGYILRIFMGFLMGIEVESSSLRTTATCQMLIIWSVWDIEEDLFFFFWIGFFNGREIWETDDLQ